MKKLFVLLMLGVSAMMAADGAKIYGKTCAECHGADGKDVSISGKAVAGSSGALAKLTGYKNGTFGGDQKAIMEGNAATLSDADMKAVAEYIDTLK